MRFSAQEEYGLRCLLQIAHTPGGFATIGDVAAREKLSVAYVAKLMRVLRRGELVESIRGQKGGYRLARDPRSITLAHALDVLGGRLYNTEFCAEHSGAGRQCVHHVDCSIRSVWSAVDDLLHRALSSTTLHDMLCGEPVMNTRVRSRITVAELSRTPARLKSLAV